MLMSKYKYNWKELLEEQEASGKKMTTFCKDRNIPYYAFKNHKYKKLKEPTKKTVPTFLPIVTDAKAEGIPLCIDGHKVEIPSTIDDVSLKRIMKAMLAI